MPVESKELMKTTILEQYKNGRIPWNKGLTKETDKRVRDYGKSGAKTKTGKPSSKKGKPSGKKAWNKGLTKETDSRVAEYAKSLTGKLLSEEHKESVRGTLLKKYSSGEIEVWNKGVPMRDESIEKMMATKLKTEKRKVFNTKPELEAKKIFEKHGINFQHQFQKQRYSFDFYLPDFNILVEIDGVYWHSKGKKDEDITNDKLKYIRQRDNEKSKLANVFGYTLIRFWEDELYKLENLIKNNFIGLEYSRYNY